MELSAQAQQFLEKFVMGRRLDLADAPDAAVPDPLTEKAQGALAKLEPLVERIIQEQRPGAAQIDADFLAAEKLLVSGKPSETIAAVKALAPAVKAALSDQPDEPTPEPLDEVTQFRKAREVWERTRTGLNAQMKSLQATILQRCAQVGIEDVQKETDELFTQLSNLDFQLETALASVEASTDQAARDKLKTQAGKLADKMLKELGSPFFKAVDTSNGFQNVSVSADATDTLRIVRSLL